MKSKAMFFGFFCLLLINSVLAQAPAWVSYETRKISYPENKFLVSFKSQSFSKKDDPAKLLADLTVQSRADIADQIRINIQTSANYQVENVNTNTEEAFKLKSQSVSEASLTGLKTESYIDHKKDYAYVISWIKIADLLLQCEANAEANKQKLEGHIASAEKLSADAHLERAQLAFYQCYPLLRLMEKDASVLAAYGKLEANQALVDLESRVQGGINGLEKNRSFNMDETVFLIADGFSKQLEPTKAGLPVFMGSFSFQDTRAGNTFSPMFAGSLAQKMVTSGFLVHQTDSKPANSVATNNCYYVTGTYWEDGDMLKLVTSIYKKPEGMIAASMEGKISLKWLQDHNIKYKPENLDLAKQRQNDLTKGDMQNDDLNIDVWTNKGNDMPVYTRNDSMNIYFTANKSCYIRLIYLLADGTKTLLIDNYRVDESMTNQVITYPEPFVCDAPFGSEIIQVMAQTAPFGQLQVYQQYGYTMIREDLKGIMLNYRGMKKADQRVQQAQKRIYLTTIDR
ncbi:MAG: DUF4384 domain-containing protein [Bacteroidetes bacterium]|nr:DUF4384 domain-containing protein [Bacteroidota bacterium]